MEEILNSFFRLKSEKYYFGIQVNKQFYSSYTGGGLPV